MIKVQPITAFLGSNGSGKSLSAVAFALTDQRKTGRPLVTNIQGLSVPHHSFESVEELPDMLAEVGSCNLLIDEAGAMFASRDVGRNKAFEKTVQQLRKYDARLLYTCPAFGRADKILREVTFMAVVCEPVWKKALPGKAWPSTRLILQKGYDVTKVDNSTTSMNRNAKAKGFGLVRTAKWEKAFDSFAVAKDARPEKRAGVTPIKGAQVQ